MSRSPLRAAGPTLLSALALVLAGCGGGASTAAATRTVTVTASAASSTPVGTAPSDSTTGDVLGSSTSSGSGADAPTDAGGDSGRTPVIPAVTAPRALTLADVFSGQQWQEGSITIPKASVPLQGIYTTVDNCSQPTKLELRFADQKGRLRVSVAQALNSAFPDVVLEFRLLADGRLVDSKTVRFNQRQTLAAELTGVSSVILEVQRVSVEGSHCLTTAVITDLSILPPAS